MPSILPRNWGGAALIISAKGQAFLTLRHAPVSAILTTVILDCIFKLGRFIWPAQILRSLLAMISYVTGLSPFAIFGILSALLSTFAYVPYIVDTLRGRTTPQRASWLIWSVLSGIALASQVFEGATDSLWFAGAQVAGTVCVCVLAFVFRGSGFLNWRDCGVLALAAGGLVAWYFTDTAIYALAITISISLAGGMVTVTKAYRDPDSETMTTWLFSGIASFLALLAVGTVDLVIMAYPLYLLTLNGMIVIAITMGRHRAVAGRWEHGLQA